MVHIKENYHKNRITSSMWRDPFKDSRKPVTQNVVPAHVRGTELDYPSKVNIREVEVAPIENYMNTEIKEVLPAGKKKEKTIKPWVEPSEHAHVWYVRGISTAVAGSSTSFVTVYSYTVSDEARVYLHGIGHTWQPNTTFKVLIDGSEFNVFNYQWGTPAVPYRFPKAAEPVKKSIVFQVKNADAVAHDYEVVLEGWVEALADIGD